MPGKLFLNNWSKVTTSSIDADDTSLDISDASALSLASNYYVATLTDGTDWEVIKITAKASNTLTIERGYEGSTAQSWPIDTVIEIRPTKWSQVGDEGLQLGLSDMPLTVNFSPDDDDLFFTQRASDGALRGFPLLSVTDYVLSHPDYINTTDDTLATDAEISNNEMVKAYVLANAGGGGGSGDLTEVQGTTNEIDVTSGTGPIPVVGLADNPIVPGTAGVGIPSGTTGQRGSTNGQIRLNTDLFHVEARIAGSWSGNQMIMDSDFAATGLMARTGTLTYAGRTITAGTGISVSNGDGVSGNPTITCTVGALSDGDKGDITVSSSGATWTIDTPSIVTLAANDKILLKDTDASDIMGYATAQAIRDLSTANETVTGKITIGGNSTAAGYIELLEDSDNGSNKIILTAPQSIVTSDKTITLPDETGTLAIIRLTAFKASLSTSQTVTAGVATKMQCSVEDYDTGGWYDNATNYRYTPQIAGKYRFVLWGYGTTNAANGQIAVLLYKNGSEIARQFIWFTSAGAQVRGSLTFDDLADGSADYYEMYCLLNGTTINDAVFMGNLIE